VKANGNGSRHISRKTAAEMRFLRNVAGKSEEGELV
jgi:hypothetical protein